MATVDPYAGGLKYLATQATKGGSAATPKELQKWLAEQDRLAAIDATYKELFGTPWENAPKKGTAVKQYGGAFFGVPGVSPSAVKKPAGGWEAYQKSVWQTPGAGLVTIGIDPHDPQLEAKAKAWLAYNKAHNSGFWQEGAWGNEFGREDARIPGYAALKKKYPKASDANILDYLMRMQVGQSALPPRSFDFGGIIDLLVEAALGAIPIVGPGLATAYGGIKTAAEGGDLLDIVVAAAGAYGAGSLGANIGTNGITGAFSNMTQGIGSFMDNPLKALGDYVTGTIDNVTGSLKDIGNVITNPGQALEDLGGAFQKSWDTMAVNYAETGNPFNNIVARMEQHPELFTQGQGDEQFYDPELKEFIDANYGEGNSYIDPETGILTIKVPYTSSAASTPGLSTGATASDIANLANSVSEFTGPEDPRMTTTFTGPPDLTKLSSKPSTSTDDSLKKAEVFKTLIDSLTTTVDPNAFVGPEDPRMTTTGGDTSGTTTGGDTSGTTTGGDTSGTTTGGDTSGTTTGGDTSGTTAGEDTSGTTTGGDTNAGGSGTDAGGSGTDAGTVISLIDSLGGSGGGQGNDSLDGGQGNGTLDGGQGNDSLDGGQGNGTLDGGQGNGTLDGGQGNDSLDGGQGNDTHSGATLDDILDHLLDGGKGNDTVDGGKGNDTVTTEPYKATPWLFGQHYLGHKPTGYQGEWKYFSPKKSYEDTLDTVVTPLPQTGLVPDQSDYMYPMDPRTDVSGAGNGTLPNPRTSGLTLDELVAAYLKNRTYADGGQIMKDPMNPMGTDIRYTMNPMGNVPTRAYKETPNMRNAAFGLASLGRGQDSMLVHMAPQEVQALQNMAMATGGSLTRNPHTGLPEAGWLSDLLPAIGGIGLSMMGFTPLQAGLTTGIISGLVSGSAKQGLIGGLGGLGGATIGRGLFGLGGGDIGAMDKLSLGDKLGNITKIPENLGTALSGFGNLFSQGPGKEAISGAGILGKGATPYIIGGGLALAPALLQPETGAIPNQQYGGNPYGKYGYDVQQKYAYKGPYTYKRKYNPKPADWDTMTQGEWEYFSPGELVDARGNRTPFAQGGLASFKHLAAGGEPTGGRYLDGPGDGMSDDIPAHIDGTQPARLADGEFVIPADVVSHIGNGSSKAGAQRLYSMMDKIRVARTGNPEQGKQIDPDKYLPA